MLRRNQKQLNMFIVCMTLLTAVLLVLASIGNHAESRMVSQVSGSFDEAWVIQDTINGDRLLDISRKVKTTAGENVILYNRLPKQLPDNCVLLVESRFSHFELAIDDMVIYQRGQETNHTIGQEPFPGYDMISIPAGYQGHTLTLTVSSSYRQYAGKIGTIWFGNRGDVLLRLAACYLPGLFMGLLLVVLSLIMFLQKTSMAGITRRRHELSYVIGMMFLAGAYLVLHNGCLRLLCRGTQGLYIGSVLLLLLLPFYYGVYLYLVVDKRAVCRFVSAAMLVQVINYVAAFVLVGLGVVDAVGYGTVMLVVEIVVFAAITVLLMAAAVRYKRAELTYHAIANIIFLVFLSAGALIQLNRSLAVYQDVIVAIGILVWCLLLLFHAEGRVADTLLGELALERKAVAEYKERTLVNMRPDRIVGGMHELLEMMKRQDERASAFLVQVSEYLRGRLNLLHYPESEMIPFTQECSHMLGCLEMAMRTTRGFSYQTEFKVVDFYVPAATIEAFVENAVQYGAGTPEQPTMISVKSYETAKEYAVQIADTGCGFEVDEKKSEDEYSIARVTKRLAEYAQATVDIRSRKGKGTVVTIKLPKQGQAQDRQ